VTSISMLTVFFAPAILLGYAVDIALVLGSVMLVFSGGRGSPACVVPRPPVT
jgi:hypothetical protein